MRWWEDESLTEAGSVVLARILPRSSQSLGRRLAWLAARARHEGILGSLTPTVRTLFDLVPAETTTPVVPPSEAIKSSQELREALLRIVPDLPDGLMPAPTGALLDLTDWVGAAGCVSQELAQCLAAGYLRGQPGQLVVPFVRAGPTSEK
jgi:hypothetical protein